MTNRSAHTYNSEDVFQLYTQLQELCAGTQAILLTLLLPYTGSACPQSSRRS